ncbi:MAG: hypothetical protein HBSAPP03_17820 [Phycisphaerae bacterium]|nr:MAG: hypothetical protein HBSAPP03_17820 [Phycisphaerae bacterium]
MSPEYAPSTVSPEPLESLARTPVSGGLGTVGQGEGGHGRRGHGDGVMIGGGTESHRSNRRVLNRLMFMRPPPTPHVGAEGYVTRGVFGVTICPRAGEAAKAMSQVNRVIVMGTPFDCGAKLYPRGRMHSA